MDHVLVEIDPDIEDTYFGMAGGSTGALASVPVPIEAKLRSLGVRLLYEVCRVQKLSVQDLSTFSASDAEQQLWVLMLISYWHTLLEIFDDAFIDYLFDLVEQTRHMHDETFNYGVIKLIVSTHVIVGTFAVKPSLGVF